MVIENSPSWQEPTLRIGTDHGQVFSDSLYTPDDAYHADYSGTEKSSLWSPVTATSYSISPGLPGDPRPTTRNPLHRENTARKAQRYARPFRSRIQVEPPEKEWLIGKRPRSAWIATWIIRLGCFLGIAILAAFMYGGWRSWETNKFCLVMEDNFDTFDESLWTREVELGGFGNGEFQWTTPYEENSYVDDGKLYIVPTVSEWPQKEGELLDLTSMGICTVDRGHSGRKVETNCVVRRNQTARTYIPPIQSARINTRDSVTIRYGRVEVRAKMPVGDWIWPAIWMLPADNTYGLWPRSGEIDIAESRGNAPGFVSVNALGGLSPGGHNTIVSTLHWGTDSPYTIDQSGFTTNGITFPSGTTSLTDDFHTFGMEWTSNSIRTYVDKRLTRVAYFKSPSAGFWSLGRFAEISQSRGFTFANPWVDAAANAPFDQEFYLIINLAVGGLGYFNTVDGILPWNVNDGREVAIEGFMAAQSSWNTTWGEPRDRGLVVDSVKMWKLCN